MRRLLLLLALVLATMAGCRHQNAAPGGSGFIEADEVVVSAQAAGQVTQKSFDEGTVVKAGDTLAVIDASRTQLDLASAEASRQTVVANLRTAQLAVAKGRETETYANNERDRIARLLKSGSATQRQMDQVTHDASVATNARQTAEANVAVLQAQIEKADADINRLKRQLEDAYLVAPVSGTVVEKYIDQGEVVSPGKAVLKIANLDSVWVKVYLPAAEFSKVKLGDRAAVSTETGGAQYHGTVVWTSAEAEFTPKNVQTEQSRANLVYAVKVSIPNNDARLKIGMPVFVTLGES